MSQTCIKCHCFSLCKVRETTQTLYEHMRCYDTAFEDRSLINVLYEFVATRCNKFILAEGCRQEEE